jgi:hypothetical protein
MGVGKETGSGEPVNGVGAACSDTPVGEGADVAIGSGSGVSVGAVVASGASFSATPSSFSAAVSRIPWPFSPQARVRRVKIRRIIVKSCTRLEVGIKVNPPH